MKHFQYKGGLKLESGAELPELTIAYHTYGKLNKDGDNVIWICHALTANSDVQDWWPDMVGEDCSFDTNHYFIVCANILGSCYGTTGPASTNPATGKPWCHQFPMVTIRDMVNAHQLLCDHLGITSIHLLVGGSMGGYQAIEWCVMNPGLIQRLFLLASSARESAWGIAIHSAQRLAIEADGTWLTDTPQAGAKGLKAARAIGMLTYRNYGTYKATQTDPDDEKLDHFKASSYIEHQGNKLVNRFNAYSYWVLTKSMDSHNICRKRSQKIEKVLNAITQPTLMISIKTDLLCPPEEQRFMAIHLANAHLVEINSPYGHDGFLVEREQIARNLSEWMDAPKTAVKGAAIK
jgi:homoserine O-acetyltransferase/O-succinyltransferase